MKKVRFILCSLIGCLVFLCSCGLDQFYVLEAPDNVINQPTIDSATYTAQTAFDNAYFEFVTSDHKNDELNGGDFKYMGTAVYYRIYNNYSTMETHKNAVDSIASSTNNSGAFSKIESYKYKELGYDNGSRSPLIPSASSDQTVKIRLTNYQDSPDYKARIEIDGTEICIPLRTGNKKSFDFGRKNASDEKDLPLSDDEDVEYSSSPSTENIWYVCLYAVAVGRDNSFTSYYSNVLYLGSVAINDDEEDN